MKRRQPIIYANANSPVGAVEVMTADEIISELKRLRALCAARPKNYWTMGAGLILQFDEWIDDIDAAGRGEEKGPGANGINGQPQAAGRGETI